MLPLHEIDKKKKELLDFNFNSVNSIITREDLQVFMQAHVYAVWDFMSLLKFMQNEITTNSIPWKPSQYSSNLVRFINEIVLEEESDELLLQGTYSSHFQLYIQAMKELNMNTETIIELTNQVDYTNLDNFLENENIPLSSRKFMKNTFKYIRSGDILQVTSAFTFGRENIIPDMFLNIIKNLGISSKESPTLYYYLKRHIELDGDTHGPLSIRLLEELAGGDEKKLKIIEETAVGSIKARIDFWTNINEEIDQNKKKV